MPALREQNLCFIFNSLEDSNSYEFIHQLRHNHPYISNIIYPPLTLYNYKQILNDYTINETKSLQTFIKETRSKKWWAKYIFKIDKKDD